MLLDVTGHRFCVWIYAWSIRGPKQLKFTSTSVGGSDFDAAFAARGVM